LFDLPMQITKTLHVTDRKTWREWLRKNYRKEKEIWLVYFRKNAGKSRVPYNDAVEEALCFGWIDSTVKKIDKDRFAQRFSRRSPKSEYSQTNKERLRKLIACKLVAKDVLAILGDIDPEQYVFPTDIMKILQANQRANENFQKYNAPYQRIRIAYIDKARQRPLEFKKRIDNFLKLTEQNKQFGFGIETYF
jgi:uncharacterized protein YdeI (YjbR/CyaY-like superfamily)